MTISTVGILNMIVMYPDSGGQNGDRQQDRIEQEEGQDRPAEPSVALERPGDQVAERDGRDDGRAVVGGGRRLNGGAECQLRPGLPAALREPRHDITVDD